MIRLLIASVFVRRPRTCGGCGHPEHAAPCSLIIDPRDRRGDEPRGPDDVGERCGCQKGRRT